MQSYGAATGTKIKNMEHQNFYGRLWGIVPALCGGFYKLDFLQIQPVSFWDLVQKLFIAFLTALLCGIAGGLGKWIFDTLKTKYFK